MEAILISLLVLVVCGYGIIKFFSWRFGKKCEKALEEIKRETEQKCEEIENLILPHPIEGNEIKSAGNGAKMLSKKKKREENKSSIFSIKFFWALVYHIFWWIQYKIINRFF